MDIIKLIAVSLVSYTSSRSNKLNLYSDTYDIWSVAEIFHSARFNAFSFVFGGSLLLNNTMHFGENFMRYCLAPHVRETCDTSCLK